LKVVKKRKNPARKRKKKVFSSETTILMSFRVMITALSSTTTFQLSTRNKMKTQHTPGPWKVGQYLGRSTSFCVHMDVGDKGRGLDIVDAVCGLDTDQRRANARLIAAAPDLLQALQALANMAESFPSELHKEHPDVIEALAAIAKATGE
jgi:hypothetical protein